LLQKPDVLNGFGKFHKDFNVISTTTISGYETQCRKTSTIIKINVRGTRAVNKTSYFWLSEIIDLRSRLKAASHLNG
jgi:hypothetical protein